MSGLAALPAGQTGWLRNGQAAVNRERQRKHSLQEKQAHA